MMFYNCVYMMHRSKNAAVIVRIISGSSPISNMLLQSEYDLDVEKSNIKKRNTFRNHKANKIALPPRNTYSSLSFIRTIESVDGRH